MQLCKSKSAAIYMSDIASGGSTAKEQEALRGDFPGPMPVIYIAERIEGLYRQYIDAMEWGPEKNAGGVKYSCWTKACCRKPSKKVPTR